jgi:drug/metabolite transporter (DMT)-like permease
MPKPQPGIPYRSGMTSPPLRPYFWMLCGCFWFSWMGVFAHSLSGTCDWQMVAFFRSFLATLFATIIALAMGAKLVWFHPRVLWIRSIAGSLSMLFTFFSLTHLPVSDVLTLTNTFPIWVALLSWPMAGERPTLGVFLAVQCSVAGVAITQKADFSQFQPAHFSALVASGMTAIAMLGLNRLKGVGSMAVVVHFSGVSTLFCFAAYLFGDREFGITSSSQSDNLFALVGVGAFATIGQVFLTKAFRAGSATKVSVVGLSQVVMVMLYEGVVQHREFTVWQLLGTVLVLGPSAYLMAREHRKPEPPPKEDEAPIEEVVVE